MAAAPHLIARQTIEVRLADRARADTLSAALRALAPRLAETIAETLDRHDGAGDRRRIERIELDLGRLPASDWEPLLLAQVSQRLDAALKAAPAPEPERPGRHSAFAALTTFVRFGHLPWWGRPGETPADLVRALAHEKPPPDALRHLLGLPGAIPRLVQQLDAASLSLLARLATGLDGPTDAPVEAGATDPASPSRPRPLPAAERAPWADYLAKVAALPAGRAPGSLPPEPPSATGPAPDALLRQLLHALLPAGDADREALARLADRLPPATVADIRRALAADLPDSARARRLALDRLAVALTAAGLASRETLAPLLARLAGPAPPAAGKPALAAAPEPDPAARPEQPRGPGAEQPGGSLPTTAAAAETDRLLVDTAGLVLLWPFLQPFMERLGLAAEGVFVSELARHRAASHFFHLATAEEALGAEERLVLAKLLAGLPLAAVHEPGEPLDDSERAAGDDLLQAVLTQAPMLGQLSVAGLRSAFLSRAGMLSVRDDHLLLRVESTGPDVLLGRLPWPFAWVRLPWMPAPLAVEW